MARALLVRSGQSNDPRGMFSSFDTVNVPLWLGIAAGAAGILYFVTKKR